MSYAYNAVNLPATLTEPDGRVSSFSCDPAYRRTATAYPNGVT